MLTDDEMAAIRARTEAATPAPWHVFQKWRIEVWDANDDQVADIGYLGDATDDQRQMMESDGAFIAHAREDIPALLAEVERLRVENAGLAQLGAAKIFYGFPGGEREQQQHSIIQAVAAGQAVWYDAVGAHCGFCDQLLDGSHADGCLVTQARALLDD